MGEPAPGTVTFLFTDIEGSTRRWEDFPDAMARALERHDAILREAIERHGGRVFKTVGDAFCATFTDPSDGLSAAIDAQRTIDGEDWSAFGDGFPPIRVRMGLHTGSARERDGDYFGPNVNRVARLEAAGHGGQVLLSGVTCRLVRTHMAAGWELHDLGEHRLKDLRHSEHIFQLRAPGIRFVDRAPNTVSALGPRDRVRVIDRASGTRASAAAGSAPGGQRWDELEQALRADGSEEITLSSDEARALIQHRPRDWREWRLGRVAEWSQPRFRLDGRFVGLSLLIDQGEQAVQGRWQATSDRFDDLGDVLDAVSDPAVVVLGPPGSGKSTLLRRLELDTAIGVIRGELAERATFFVSLSTYGKAATHEPLPSPARWLNERWSERFPHMPALDDLLAAGRVTLLLDALNEMPSSGPSDFRARAQAWKRWLIELTSERPGNRVVFSCRSLDYSQPLSTPELRVPQVRIEPLTDAQIRAFLAVYSPGRWREIWQALDGSVHLGVLRSPYFLSLLVEQVEATGEVPRGRAALFTGFVRQALRRELERGNAVFDGEDLLSTRDRRQIVGWRWRDEHDLPERGALMPQLARLAETMQRDPGHGERHQVRVDIDRAVQMLDADHGDKIIEAGEALAILDEDEAAFELMFVHQLVQEYFAARRFAVSPDFELVRTPWRADDVRPSVERTLDGLDPADPLPGLPQTGWEETTLLASTMTADPGSFLNGVSEANLPLAGRAAAQPDLRPVAEPVVADLRGRLVQRSRDRAADLRHRIVCGEVLGDLGDPRFQRGRGTHRPYIEPSMIQIPGGRYPIGGDEPIQWVGGRTTAHRPRHAVEVNAFAIGRFAVTNAEWRCFQDAGGYDDERWWETAEARAWREGVGTRAGTHANVRFWRARIQAEPALRDRFVARGTWSEEIYERWSRRLKMTDDEFEAHLQEMYPEERLVAPRYWEDERLGNPTQPVVGVCWFEARAYACWLSAQTGEGYRLPTEVEWEATARGTAGRRYAYGDRFDRTAANSSETQLRRTAPVGVFADGDTPEGVADLSGNTWEWTSSAFGRDPDVPEFGYPYDGRDGREEPDTPNDVLRISRGGAWHSVGTFAVAFNRSVDSPDTRNSGIGFRLALNRPVARG